MQPNFAFETAPALEILPQSRTAEYLSSKPPSRDACASEPSKRSESHSSFQSSLREASRGQEDHASFEPADESPDQVQRPDRDTGPGMTEESNTQAVSDKGRVEEHDHSDDNNEKVPADLTDPTNTEPVIEEEVLDNELSGIGAVAMTAPLTETADPDPAVKLKLDTNASEVAGHRTSPADPDPAIKLKLDTNASEVAGHRTSPKVSSGDMPVGGAGTDSPNQKGALTGQNNGALQHGPENRVELPETEIMNDDKNNTKTIPKSVIGADQVAVDAAKGSDDWAKIEPRIVQTDKSNGIGGPDSAAADGVKTNGSERVRDPLQALQQLQAELSAAGQRSQTAKVAQAEEVAVARNSEVSNEQLSASRLQSDLLQGNDGDGKNELAAADEAATKIAKMNPNAKDSAFMQHQDQSFERLMEPAAATREKEPSPGLLRTQTIDQIVNRAVYQLKNGQNSVRIDLKPEFLGQVRMQIVTVDQQVSIRIAAELPVVKEMLENNLQQLKADLQQQGLEVDEIEVSVSTDSQHNAQNQKAKSDLLSQLKTSAEEEGGPSEVPASEMAPRGRTSDLAVDMFV